MKDLACGEVEKWEKGEKEGRGEGEGGYEAGW